MVYAANIFGCTGARRSRARPLSFAVTDRIPYRSDWPERYDIVIYSMRRRTVA